jgi:hypothetical protein
LFIIYFSLSSFYSCVRISKGAGTALSLNYVNNYFLYKFKIYIFIIWCQLSISSSSSSESIISFSIPPAYLIIVLAFFAATSAISIFLSSFFISFYCFAN